MSTIERAIRKGLGSGGKDDGSSRVVPLERRKSAERRDPNPPELPRVPAAPDARQVAEGLSARVGGIQVLDLECLRSHGLLNPDEQRSRLAEEFRVIKRPILRNAFGAQAEQITNPNLVMVTSSLAKEGKTFCSINLALSICREVDRTVLLVDADVARPSILRYLGIGADVGLMDLLEDPTLDPAAAILRTDIPNLSVLPAGNFHQRSTELLASDKMARLTDEMAERYPDRLVVFDSPPLLATSEASVLAEHMGQVVLVVESERTPEAAVAQSLEQLKGCGVVMTLLNRAPRMPMSNYGYGYGYGYGQSAADE